MKFICFHIFLPRLQVNIQSILFQEFVDTGKRLFKLFISSQRTHGKTVYNRQVGLQAQMFVEENMSPKE